MSGFHCRYLVTVGILADMLMLMSKLLSVTLSLSLCFHFNGYFPGEPGLAGTGVSPFWILLERRMMEVVVTTEAIRRAKLQ